MTPKNTVASVIAALALSASIAGPTLGAAPTFTGPVTCTRFGVSVDMNIRTLTKQDMAAFRRFWVDAGFCDRGTVDYSAMVQD